MSKGDSRKIARLQEVVTKPLEREKAEVTDKVERAQSDPTTDCSSTDGRLSRGVSFLFGGVFFHLRADVEPRAKMLPEVVIW